MNEMTNLIAAIEKKTGPLSLFMMLGTEENATSMLTLIVSAVMLDYTGPQDAVKMIISCLKENSSTEVQNSIARVNVRPTNDPLVNAITGMMSVEGGPVRLQNMTINNVFIFDGAIYKSARYDRK